MLRDKAMLVRLSISQWSGRRFDKKATAEVETAHNTKNIGRFNKTLVDPQLLKGVTTAAGRIRTAHYMRTMPWDDAEYRLLPSEMYYEHSELMQQLEDDFWNQVNHIVDNYDLEVQRSSTRLGPLFDPSEYPSPAELRARYDVRWSIIPLPDKEDFRIDLGAEEVARIQEGIEERIASATHAAVADIWHRLAETVKRAHDRLSTPDAVFRDTLIGNIEDLCGLIPKLNVTNDPELERLRLDVEAKLAGHEPQTLRDNQTARKQVADDASSILSEMDRMMEGWR